MPNFLTKNEMQTPEMASHCVVVAFGRRRLASSSPLATYRRRRFISAVVALRRRLSQKSHYFVCVCVLPSHLMMLVQAAATPPWPPCIACSPNPTTQRKSWNPYAKPPEMSTMASHVPPIPQHNANHGILTPNRLKCQQWHRMFPQSHNTTQIMESLRQTA